MALSLINVTIDCRDVWRVARFWSSALDRPVDDWSSEEFASIGARDVERREPAWFFQRVPEENVGKNRVHVDLVDPDPDLVERLVAIGAKVVGEHDLGFHRWTVMEVPEGNVFCVSGMVFAG
jgi:hypothetical protein